MHIIYNLKILPILTHTLPRGGGDEDSSCLLHRQILNYSPSVGARCYDTHLNYEQGIDEGARSKSPSNQWASVGLR